jgi:hypothetical protein
MNLYNETNYQVSVRFFGRIEFHKVAIYSCSMHSQRHPNGNWLIALTDIWKHAIWLTLRCARAPVWLLTPFCAVREVRWSLATRWTTSRPISTMPGHSGPLQRPYGACPWRSSCKKRRCPQWCRSSDNHWCKNLAATCRDFRSMWSIAEEASTDECAVLAAMPFQYCTKVLMAHKRHTLGQRTIAQTPSTRSTTLQR